MIDKLRGVAVSLDDMPEAGTQVPEPQAEAARPFNPGFERAVADEKQTMSTMPTTVLQAMLASHRRTAVELVDQRETIEAAKTVAIRGIESTYNARQEAIDQQVALHLAEIEKLRADTKDALNIRDGRLNAQVAQFDQQLLAIDRLIDVQRSAIRQLEAPLE